MTLWIARDKNGDLNVYLNKPVLDKDSCVFLPTGDGFRFFDIDKKLFTEVTYENSPMQIELHLIK